MNSFRMAFGISLFFHTLVLALYWRLSNDEPLVKLPPSSIQVSLAKLGEQRDQTLLPRVDASAAQPSPDFAKAKSPSPKRRGDSPLDILKKRFGKADKSGNPKGHLRGTSLTSELADSYELQVVEMLRENYEIPRVINDREAERLKLLVRLWIGPQGDLIKIKIQQASRNNRFDQAVLLGSQKISSFGAPPLPLVRQYKTEGLLIQFCPLECS